MPRAHARLSPSSAARWIRCPASVKFIEDEQEEDEAGLPADEGTVLHTFCEECLRHNISPFNLVGRVGRFGKATVEITEDIADQMLAGLDIIDEIPGKLFIERQVDLNFWLVGQFGTSDVFIIGKRILTVFDWKWGYLPVDAVDNDQLRIYALGVYDNFVKGKYPNIDTIRIIIYQPRAPGGGGEWGISLEELLAFGEKVRKAGEATYKKNARFVPGNKQCAYCPGAKNLSCNAYVEWNMDQIVADFEEMDEEIEMDIPMRTPKPTSLTPARRSHIIKNRAAINKFLDRLQADALDDALKGRSTPGLKAVDGRNPPRKWLDKEEAERELNLVLADPYDKRLISPTTLEKTVGHKLYRRMESRYVDLGEPKPVLVPEGDKRPRKTLLDELDDD